VIVGAAGRRPSSIAIARAETEVQPADRWAVWPCEVPMKRCWSAPRWRQSRDTARAGSRRRWASAATAVHAVATWRNSARRRRCTSSACMNQPSPAHRCTPPTAFHDPARTNMW